MGDSAILCPFLGQNLSLRDFILKISWDPLINCIDVGCTGFEKWNKILIYSPSARSVHVDWFYQKLYTISFAIFDHVLLCMGTFLKNATLSYCWPPKGKKWVRNRVVFFSNIFSKSFGQIAEGGLLTVNNFHIFQDNLFNISLLERHKNFVDYTEKNWKKLNGKKLKKSRKTVETAIFLRKSLKWPTFFLI